MFYKIKPILFVAIIISLLSSNAYSQGFDLLSEELVAPPAKQEEVKEQAKAPNNPKKAEDKKEDLAPANNDPLLPPAPKANAGDDIADLLAQSSAPIMPIDQSEDLLVETTEEVQITPIETQTLIEEYNDSLDNEIFGKMTDLERESALLTLQLKKEKIRNDIEAVKKQRQAAEDQERERKEAIEEKKRKAIEESQRLMLVEQQKLKEKEIEYEKLRQEKLVNQYKETMLEEKQKWVSNSAALYKNINSIKAQQIKSFGGIKDKFEKINASTIKATNEALKAKEEKEKEITALKTQISVLKTQIEALQAQNPFADDGTGNKRQKLDNLYVIMEIRGKEDNLIARLLNKEGQSFLAQKGTVLQSGHVVDDITETYLKANKNGHQEYIYFTSGATIMQKEPLKKDSPIMQNAKPTPTAAQTTPVQIGRRFNVY